MIYPTWVENPKFSDEIRSRARFRYLVMLAALLHNEQASITSLAKACGFHREAFQKALRQGTMSAGMAAAVELAVDRQITKEMLAPEKFAA